MKAELIIDRPEMFRITRMGSWRCIYDYETQTSRWQHDSESDDPTCQCGHRIGSHAHATYGCWVCECPKFKMMVL